MDSADNSIDQIRMTGIRDIALKDIITRYGHIRDLRTDADEDIDGRIDLRVSAMGLTDKPPFAATCKVGIC